MNVVLRWAVRQKADNLIYTAIVIKIKRNSGVRSAGRVDKLRSCLRTVGSRSGCSARELEINKQITKSRTVRVSDQLWVMSKCNVIRATAGVYT